MRKRLKVEPIAGEIMRFHVESQRAGIPPYLVDLEALDCNGCCGCQNFEHRIYPLVKAQLHLPFEQRTPIGCIHIIDATEYFVRQIKKALSDDLKKRNINARPTTGELQPEQKRGHNPFGFLTKLNPWHEQQSR